MVRISRKILAIICAVAVCIFIVAVFLWFNDKSPAEKIKNRCNEFASLVSRPAGDVKGAERLVRIGKYKNFFFDPCKITIQSPSYDETLSPRAIGAQIMKARGRAGDIDVDFRDMSVELQSEKEAAVRCTVLGSDYKQGESVRDAREISCTMKKQDGDWLFAEITEIQVMER